MFTTFAYSDLEDIPHEMNKQVNKLQLVDVFTNVLRRKVFTKVLVDVFTQVLARYDKRNVFRPGGLHWLAFHSRDRCNDLNCILQYCAILHCIGLHNNIVYHNRLYYNVTV